MTRTVPPAALALIERDEGCVLHEYLDSGGKPSIGFGHTGPDVTPGEVVTPAGAEALLAHDADAFAALVDAQLGDAPTSGNQFGAMTSLSYNIGDAAFGRSTVLRRHLTGDFAGAAAAFLMWDEIHGKPIPGLLKRRQDERALYLTPDSRTT